METVKFYTDKFYYDYVVWKFYAKFYYNYVVWKLLNFMLIIVIGE